MLGGLLHCVRDGVRLGGGQKPVSASVRDTVSVSSMWIVYPGLEPDRYLLHLRPTGRASPSLPRVRRCPPQLDGRPKLFLNLFPNPDLGSSRSSFLPEALA